MPSGLVHLPSGLGPLAVVLEWLDLGKVHRMHDAFGRVEAAQPFSHGLIDEAIVDERRLPTHSADEPNRLHGKPSATGDQRKWLETAPRIIIDAAIRHHIEAHLQEQNMKGLSFAMAGAVVFAFLSAPSSKGNKPEQQATAFTVHPIGHVKKADDRTLIVLDKKYEPGLLGLEGFSHVYVFWWFDRNDTSEKRSTLQVYPMGNKDNPLTGVFATRSPVRPNLIALTLCKLVSTKENIIEIEKTDAFDGTPVLDIKPFIPGYDSTPDAKLPEWLVKARKQRQKNP